MTDKYTALRSQFKVLHIHKYGIKCADIKIRFIPGSVNVKQHMSEKGREIGTEVVSFRTSFDTQGS